MQWIQFRKDELIPEELKYPNWKTDKNIDGETPLIMLARYRMSEPIPDELLELQNHTQEGLNEE
jgi:hypothetical protein